MGEQSHGTNEVSLKAQAAGAVRPVAPPTAGFGRHATSMPLEF
jgi:hypothetical protein